MKSELSMPLSKCYGSNNDIETDEEFEQLNSNFIYQKS